MIGMYVCLGKHTYLETRGMYVCQRYVYLGKHTYLENDRYVCMSAETYTPRNYRYVCMSGFVVGEGQDKAHCLVNVGLPAGPKQDKVMDAVFAKALGEESLEKASLVKFKNELLSGPLDVD